MRYRHLILTSLVSCMEKRFGVVSKFPKVSQLIRNRSQDATPHLIAFKGRVFFAILDLLFDSTYCIRVSIFIYLYVHFFSVLDFSYWENS